MSIVLSNMGQSSRKEMQEDIAQMAFRQMTFVVIATFLAHHYPHRYPPSELVKWAAREGMGWNISQFTPSDIVIEENGERCRASTEIYCPVISVPLFLRAILIHDENPEQPDEQIIYSQVSLESVSVRYGKRKIVIGTDLLQKCVNALCSAEPFPEEMMSWVSGLWD